MSASDLSPDAGPPLAAFDDEFYVEEVQRDGDTLYYYGMPLRQPDVVMQNVWQAFRDAGYEPQLTTRGGRYVIVAEPAGASIDGIPWKNVLLFLATVVSTLFVGAQWFFIDPFANPWEAVTTAWPFSAAILVVLGTHELGHYVMSRYHDVDASLPYFIPFPTLIGTMGAVIRMRGRMPDRKALFDIGAAGPLAGLVATVAVTVVGLYLPPVQAPPGFDPGPNAVTIQLAFPPLIRILAGVTGQPLTYTDPTVNIHPVVIGGWAGCFVTLLNLIPVGQLDGGHIMRAMFGERQEAVATVVPVVLFALAGFLHFVEHYSLNNVFIWIFWGGLAAFVAAAGSARPVSEEEDLDVRRKALGVLTFALGILCFMPVPVAIVG
ncbi:site-2 protease family protein [Haloarchaeobius amylolyticus]|uniref:site-2 protease family protein n=1 Tax=Haloarchaeobius amylolyticus TaxID=1198296 RepID=UPI002271A1EF|nr:site-2 protease family protein [Haloarchaeobius amylolyticus]